MAGTMRVDAVVIGSGPGGYVAGIRLGQLGVKAVVVERAKVGGVCLNVGCIPSKALIHVAKTLDKMRHAGDLGIQLAAPPTLDWAATQRWKDGIVGKLTQGVRQLLKVNGAELLEGEAAMTDPRTVEVKKADGSVVHIETANVIVATGSRPVELPGFAIDGERVIGSTGALALTEVPRRLVVIGGGYIGLELGTVYAKAGAKVTVLEALPTLLAGMDAECVQVVARKLKRMGVEVLTGAKAMGWQEQGGRAVVSVEAKGGQKALVDADKILVTVGRRPNTDSPWFETLGIARDAKGFVKVDRQQRTNVAGVYAIGDCATGPMLAHKASKEAEVAAEVIAGKKAEMDARAIPAAVFTDPEIAQTGLGEEQAAASGRKLKVGKYPFAALGRALSVNDPDGFAKVIADADTGAILGVHVVGAGASDLIAEGTLAIEMGALLADVALTVHAHPTLPEALMEAAKAALGEAIHIVNK